MSKIPDLIANCPVLGLFTKQFQSVSAYILPSMNLALYFAILKNSNNI